MFYNTKSQLHQVNQIRDSLAIMGDNSTAFSLPQVCLVPWFKIQFFFDFLSFQL